MDSFGIPPQRKPLNTEEDPDTPIPSLPRRTANPRRGVHTATFGSQPSQVSQIRAWCRKGIPVDPLRALRVETVASELVTNALAHSASGQVGGRIRVEMEPLTNRLIRIAVTDDGPRTDRPITLPHLPSQTNTWAEHGRGLHLVDRLSEAWGWEGKLGRPSTVWANLDPYAPIPDTAQA